MDKNNLYEMLFCESEEDVEIKRLLVAKIAEEIDREIMEV